MTQIKRDEVKRDKVKGNKVKVSWARSDRAKTDRRRDLGQRARSHYSSEVTLEEIERFYYQARASHALSQS